MMIEFLIRRDDDEWFSFPYDEFRNILRPIRTPSRKIDGWGSNRIEVEGEEISFSDEDLGFQVVFETGKMTDERAGQIIAEICENIEAVTGQKVRIVPL
jgi:hypothetical protein